MPYRGAGGTKGGEGSFIIRIMVRPQFGLGNQMYSIGGFPVTTGLVLVPFAFGVSMVFYNSRNWLGWLLAGRSVIAMMVGVIGMYASRYREAWMQYLAVQLSGIARDLDVPAVTLAVAWQRRHAPEVHPILSARPVEQLQPSPDGMTYEMGEDLYAAITALSSTPAPAMDRLEDA